MSLTVLLSPAKKLNFESEQPTTAFTQPIFWSKTEKIAKALKKLSAKKIGALMNLSPALSELNYQRNQDFSFEQNKDNSKAAGFVFNGEVYTGLNIHDFTEKELQFANNHINILSGLYGILKPLDLIQPYRLEMGTKFPVGRKKNLYELWDNDIAKELNSKETPCIINLASNEYFKAAQVKSLKTRIITPVFKDFKNGQYKTIMVFAKKSRGAMARYVVKNNISDPEKLKAFDTDGYSYDENLSSENEWVFTR